MKKSCFPFFVLFLLNTCAPAQAILQIGEPFVADQGYDLLITQDGGFVTCGNKGNNAIVYKSDCAGTLTNQIEKSYAPGPGRFYDAVQMNDGSIVAVGSATIATSTDTLERILILKTSPDLAEIAVANYPVSGKAARAKSVALASNGNLLVFGDVAGDSPNLSDMFLLRVDQSSLLPIFNPAIYNIINGVDIAAEIIPTADGNYLLAGSSYSGNIFGPDAIIANRLVVMKATENGPLLWTYLYLDTFPAQYGGALAGGVEQNPVSGNIMLSGTTYGGSPVMHQDALFILLGNNGDFLDSALLQAPMRQGIYGMTGYADLPGLFLAVGDSDNPVFGVPNLFAAQAFELDGQILQTALTNEMASPLSLSDVIELGQNRLAVIATIPDNPTVLNSKDIIVATPQIDNIGILYQNCALVASFSAVGPVYQWYLDGIPIPGATAGVYFPAESGSYRVQITDNIGCSGISDTLTVTLASAGFDVEVDNLTTAFANTSTGATSYTWDFGDGTPFSSETNPTHTFSSGGSYTVTLIASSPCSADTLTQTIGLVSAEEHSWLPQCRVFPNPGTGKFLMEIKDAVPQELVLSLINPVGQVIFHQVLDFRGSAIQRYFDLGEAPPGIYTMRIQGEDKTGFVKVVVVK